VLIQPLSIAYTHLHGLPIGRQHRPVVAWYGSLDLLPHLAEIMRHGAIDVVITFGEPLAYDGRADRKQLGRCLEACVRRATAEALCGHSLPGGKSLRGGQAGDARRDTGMSSTGMSRDVPSARAAPIEVTPPA
jgi:hypothetical protein